MSRALLLVVLTVVLEFVLPTTVYAQRQTQLQLTAEILERNYCSKSETLSLQLKVRLRYTNLSAQRLILYKGHDLFFQTKIRNEAGEGIQPYEVHLINMHYFDEEFERIDAGSPGRVFVTLPPNGTFERELIAGIGVTDPSGERSSTTVKPGWHSLYFIVSTWYQSPKLAEKLRQQWQRKGLLWSQPVFSQSIKIDISKPASASPCR